ncbi:MAG: WGR domain-containing protein [Patescibacteria group bacterium]
MTKAWKEHEDNQPVFHSNYKVIKRWEGNQTNVITNSNKFYHAEIQVAPDGKARIYTVYGRVGASGSKEYRYYSSESACLSDYDGLIRKKRDRKKDPYREVDLAITSVGSDGAQQIKKPMTGITGTTEKTVVASLLHPEVQRLVSNWFGVTGKYITMTLKCPLGQLTKEQIDKGRIVLDDCKSRINSKTKTNEDVYDNLTSQFYSLIPHVLPHKIDPFSLRLNSLDKIMAKHDMLDTFLDAKNVENVMGNDSIVDEQYKKLNAYLEWLDPKDPVNSWIVNLVNETRASNHSFLGKVKIFNIYRLARKQESGYFSSNIERVSREISGKLEKPRFTTLQRPDLSNDERKLFTQSNVWPLWHGTRPQNMVGIITRGLTIRPSGAVYTGSMFGDALYFAESSSKSMNYCGSKGAYWSGSSGNDSVFMFLADVIVGKPHVVTYSQFFRQPPSGCHSVYAVPGGGLYNSENMIYNSSGPNQQHRLKYIVEFQTNM